MSACVDVVTEKKLKRKQLTTMNEWLQHNFFIAVRHESVECAFCESSAFLSFQSTVNPDLTKNSKSFNLDR